MLSAGTPAPEFELPDTAGTKTSLNKLLSEGVPVLLAFFKASCPTCQLIAPFLERFSREGGFKVTGVSQDNAAVTGQFRNTFGITFPVLLDDTRTYPASNAYGLTHVPSLFLVSPNGAIRWTSQGFSKGDLQQLGKLLQFTPFRPGENVPGWKAG